MLAQRQQNLLEYMRKLIRRDAAPNVSKMLSKSDSADLNVVFRVLYPLELEYVFKLLINLPNAISLMEKMDVTIVAQGLNQCPPPKIASILKQLEADDAADILGELPEEISEAVIPLMKEEGKEVEELMQYPDDTAGGIMNPHVFSLSENLTVKEAIEALQKNEETEMVFYLYVVDDFTNLVGVISLRQLLTIRPTTKLKNIMATDVIRVDVNTDQEEVARMVSQQKLLALPVVDQNNRLMGIITVDDVIDVLREEATEDFLKLAGADQEAFNLTSVAQSTKERLPWLLATLVGGALAAEVIGHFDSLITRISVLSGFIPVIIGMGGNLGTQSSTIVVRGLATGRIQTNQLWAVLWKEFRVALGLGTVYGIGFGTFAYFRFPQALPLGFVVGVSICLSMVLAVLIGTFIPILFERVRIDPAIATGPFVTTTVDIFGCLIYLSIASSLL